MNCNLFLAALLLPGVTEVVAVATTERAHLKNLIRELEQQTEESSSSSSYEDMSFATNSIPTKRWTTQLRSRRPIRPGAISIWSTTRTSARRLSQKIAQARSFFTWEESRTLYIMQAHTMVS